MLSIKNLDLKYQNGFSLVAEKLGIELGDNGLVVHVVLAPHLSVGKNIDTLKYSNQLTQ